ncbi:MAG: hypothetical protein AB7T59_16340 [Hyphomonadaceae bacterium]
MTRPNQPARSWLRLALLGVAVVAAITVLAPNAFAAGIGRVLADLWITVMAAVAGLLGGVLQN